MHSPLTCPTSPTTPLLLLAATQQELRPIVRHLRLRPQSPTSAVGIVNNHHLLALTTGISAARALDHLKRLPHQPPGIINLGFAAALHPDLQPAQLISLDQVRDQHANHLPLIPHPLAPHPVALQNTTPTPGTLITLDHILSTPADKLQTFQSTHAVAADMESFAVARYAARHAIPYNVLRAVSDDAATALPPALARLIRTDGRLHLPRAARWMLTHPHRLPAMLTLNRHAQQAAHQLALACEQTLTSTTLDLVNPKHIPEPST